MRTSSRLGGKEGDEREGEEERKGEEGGGSKSKRESWREKNGSEDQFHTPLLTAVPTD